MATLLEKAKAVHAEKRERIYSFEEEEVCLAWLNDEIKLTQVQEVLRGAKHKNGAQVYVFLARCSRQIFLKANSKIRNKKK